MRSGELFAFASIEEHPRMESDKDSRHQCRPSAEEPTS
jgi:hypothetical protein